MPKVRLGLAQINPTVGDLEGNAKKIGQFIDKAQELEVDILSFPELSLTGYPPEDLLLKPHFIEENLQFLKELAKKVKEIIAVVGFVDRKNHHLFNAAAIMYNQKVFGIYHKICLPNYGVFDEKRYFTPGSAPLLFEAGKIIFGVNICEDIWEEVPTKVLAEKGAQVIVNINASPYHTGKGKERERLLKERAKENSVIIVYNNMVAGQDELVFDGAGMVFNKQGNLIAHGKQFEEDLVVTDLEVSSKGEGRRAKGEVTILSEEFSPKKSTLSATRIGFLPRLEEIYQALVLGTKDYVRKNGFKKVVIGLSGGIDSSLVATVAVDALGKENVISVSMPSPYSSEESLTHAKDLAQGLGITLITVPISQTFESYKEMFKKEFKGLKEDITEENLQARIRGNILMALSNKFGYLVLTTGNKSEMSVGYATLYGDMAGGFGLLKDVPKTLVYELSRYRNSLGKVIPEAVLTKEPSAELRPKQKDLDTLPPYEVLDPILEAYVEEDKSFEEIVALGYDEKVVREVIQMVDKNEYKRRQAPPGIKITPKAFGKDRRMPITNRYQSS